LVKEDITADYVVCGVDTEVLSWLAQAYRWRSYRLFIWKISFHLRKMFTIA
jgi:hypothetical protein